MLDLYFIDIGNKEPRGARCPVFERWNNAPESENAAIALSSTLCAHMMSASSDLATKGGTRLTSPPIEILMTWVADEADMVV